MRRLWWASARALIALGSALPAAADDLALAREVANRLHESGRLQGYNIGVKHKSGVVWLRGQVATPQQAQAACAIARQTPDVKKVINRLTVGGGAEGEAELAQAHLARNDRSGDVRRTSAVRGPAVRPTMARQVDGEEMIEEGAPMSGGRPLPIHGGNYVVPGGQPSSAVYDEPQLPGYAWPSYAAYPNYAAVTYPKQYSPTAWPYIGPFYPYPQVPLGWRKVTLEWDDGWWMLDFKD